METPIRRFRIEDELWESAERVAADMDRSVSWLIRKAVEEYVDRHRAAKRAAKQAEADQKPDAQSRRDRRK
jgi:predicted transcriptional regulator